MLTFKGDFLEKEQAIDLAQNDPSSVPWDLLGIPQWLRICGTTLFHRFLEHDPMCQWHNIDEWMVEFIGLIPVGLETVRLRAILNDALVKALPDLTEPGGETAAATFLDSFVDNAFEACIPPENN